MKQSKKNILKNTIIFICMIIIIVLVTLYISNEAVRNVIDRYILRKEVSEEQTVSIELSGDENKSIFAYDKYIVVLNNGLLTSYNSFGNKAFTNEISISNPIFVAKDKFLCIAEKQGNKIYLLSGGNIVWQNDVEGSISQINVNKNGYVSAIVKGTSHKTVILTYNDKGKELFKTYLSSTNPIKAQMSNDNKYLAVAEVNSSGSIVQSYIKLISVQKAENDPTNSVEYTYKAEPGRLIIDMEYQDKNKLVCMYNDVVEIIENEKNQEVFKMTDKTTYVSIDLKNATLNIQEKQKGIFNTNQEVLIKDINHQTENLYTVDGVINFIETKGNNIAINMGSDVHFINTSRMVTKKI